MKDDAISRQAVLKLLSTMPPEEAMTKAMLIQSVQQMDAAQPEITLESAINYLHNIGWMQEHDRILTESAQHERKRGKWLCNSPVTMKCNQCGLVIKDWDWHRFKYCPNCGADMREGEKE